MRKKGNLMIKIAIAIVLTFIGLYLVQVDYEVDKTVLKTTTFSSITGDSVLTQEFNDTTTISNITFYPGHLNETKYLYLRKNLNVTNATLNLTGYKGYYANESFAVNSTGIIPTGGFAFNGTHFFVLENSNPARIQIHNITGGYFGSLNLTGVNFGAFSDIYMNDTTIFALKAAAGDINNSVYQFNLSGNLITSFNLTNLSFPQSPVAIASNNSDFWVSTAITTTGPNVYRFNMSFNYTNFSITNIGAGSTASDGAGITTNGSVIWLVGKNNLPNPALDIIHIIYANGTYITGFKTRQPDNTGASIPKDVEYNGTFLWILEGDNTARTIHKYFQDGVLPLNPYIDVGSNGVAEWNFSGNFSQTKNITINIAPAINNYLSTCAAAVNGNCTVPLFFVSSTTGIIEYSSISIDSNDTTPPTVTINLASSSIPLGASTSISCLASDNIEVISLSMSIDGTSCSGINSCSLTYQGGSSGSKSISCSAADSNTNSAATTSTLSVTDGSGGGG